MLPRRRRGAHGRPRRTRIGAVRWPGRARRSTLADSDEDARYWLGPLLNNLGWEHYEAGEHGEALVAFERALAERERDPENGAAIAIARYAVAKTLRALGRPEEAVVHIESAAASDADDGWFQEELAETYAALGRNEDAGRTREARAGAPSHSRSCVRERQDCGRVGFRLWRPRRAAERDAPREGCCRAFASASARASRARSRARRRAPAASAAAGSRRRRSRARRPCTDSRSAPCSRR